MSSPHEFLSFRKPELLVAALQLRLIDTLNRKGKGKLKKVLVEQRKVLKLVQAVRLVQILSWLQSLVARSRIHDQQYRQLQAPLMIWR